MTQIENVNRRKLIRIIGEVGGGYRSTAVKLSGGGETHVYLDVKGILDRSSRMRLATTVMLSHLVQCHFTDEATAIGGPTMGADVLSHALALKWEIVSSNDLKWFSVRDKAKTDHGLGRWIEGAELADDDRVIITDDVASTGKSLREAYERVIQTGAKVLAVIPLVERGDKAAIYFQDRDVPYLPVIHYSELDLTSLGGAVSTNQDCSH